MGAFTVGQVIVLPFPFSDLSRQKNRPALLLADAEHGDWVLCQITSNPFMDSRAVELTSQDFSAGGLQRTSYARSGKLFTANQSLMLYAAGKLTLSSFHKTRNAVIALLQESPL